MDGLQISGPGPESEHDEHVLMARKFWAGR